MTLSNEELEKELRALNPKRTSQVLEQKIEQALGADEPAGSKNIIRFWPIIALASAACLALVLILANSQNTEVSSSPIDSITFTDSAINGDAANSLDEFQAVGAEQRLIEAIDEGVFITADNELIRKLRYQFIDTVTMVSQIDGSVFRMEIPREEALFVPVTLL